MNRTILTITKNATSSTIQHSKIDAALERGICLSIAAIRCAAAQNKWRCAAEVFFQTSDILVRGPRLRHVFAANGIPVLHGIILIQEKATIFFPKNLWPTLIHPAFFAMYT